MKAGYQASGKTFKVHLDGYNFLPYFKGEAKKGPRDVDLLLRPGRQSQRHPLERLEGELRHVSEGNIATATREVTAWAMITNLRMDPYERGMKEGGDAMDFLGRQMWLLVPVQARSRSSSPTSSSSPTRPAVRSMPRGINYGLLQQQQAMKRLKDIEGMAPR